jgi:prepilin-type N-terminal cleavage/methylation domain-containing protein
MNTRADYVQFLGTNKELITRAFQYAPLASQKGFTLLEVVIAASLAAFGILAAGQLLFTSAASIRLARSREAAVLAAHNKLEDLCGLYLRDAAHEDLSAGEHGPEYLVFPDPNDGSIRDKFRISWSIEALQDPRPGWKTAAVRLTVAATPVKNDGTLIERPYSGRTVVLPAVLEPQIK